MRDPNSDESVHYIRKTSPQEMARLAQRTHASTVVSSYNEPLTASERAVGIFRDAKVAGLMSAYVSNGNNTPEVMKYIRSYISAYKIDFKCMQDKNYRKLGGVLQNTLDGIKRAHDMGLWVEIVTLTIPGFNDSNEELWDAARFIAGVSPDIPWHVTAFHRDYKMMDHDNTDVKILLRAAEIGREAGLRYVYAGNLPGRVSEYEDTFCPKNLGSIRVLQAIGPRYAQDWATRFGFEADKHPAFLTMALGAGSVTPWLMLGGYSIFANGGYGLNLHLISKVTDANGKTQMEARPVIAGESAPRVLDERNAFVMDSLLKEVARTGTAARASALLKRTDIGGKTGTTNDSHDAWFAGYGGDLVAVAWLGFDQPRPLRERETGGGLALPIWINYSRQFSWMNICR